MTSKREVRRKGDISNISSVEHKTKCWIKQTIAVGLMTLRDVYELFNQYLDNETESDIAVVFNQSMTLPQFTVCVPQAIIVSRLNSSRLADAVDIDANVEDNEALEQALAKLSTDNAMLTERWDRRALLSAFTSIGTLQTIERESDDSFVVRELSLLRKEDDGRLTAINFWLNEINKRNVSFDALMEKVGDEILKRMVKSSRRVSMLNDTIYESKFRTTFISDGGVCFQPTWSQEAAHDDIRAQGHFFALTIEHDPDLLENDDLHCLMVDMNGRRADMSRFQGGGHTRDGTSEDICPGTTSDLSVEVRAVYKMLDNTEPGTACVDDSDEAAEDEFECRARCRMQLIQSICQCMAVSLQSYATPEERAQYSLCNYTNCDIDVQTAPKSERDCSIVCRRSCVQTRYMIGLVGSKESIGDVTSNATIDDDESNQLAPQLTKLRLSWGSFEYLELEQSYKYESIVDFFAEVGGGLGIWLGLSLLSIIQGTAWLAEYHLCLYTNHEDEVEDETEDVDDVVAASRANNQKFSQNPLGELAANPFGDFQDKTTKRKRSAQAT